MTFKNGDVFDIGQTVNGISKFIYIDGKWHYYSEQIMREYEYDQADLEKIIININEYEEIEFVGNIFSQLPQQEISDEEIEKKANSYIFERNKQAFKDGAKWYREQLKQNK